MKDVRKYLFAPAIIIAGCAIFSVADLAAKGMPGSVSGTVRDSSNAPVSGAKITLASDAGDYSLDTASDETGSFRFEVENPGTYKLEAQAEGYQDTASDAIHVDAGESTRTNIVLPAKLQGGFLKRLFQAYSNDWKASDSASGPAPAFRGYPGAVTNPPFPFSVWPYGGSVTIGQHWPQSGPLMQAIWSGPDGDAWKRSGVQIYGWLNGGFNVSTSKQGGYSNFPEAYAERGNGVELDQEVLYIERQPNTVQTDSIDWGFRISALYGLDYRFTTAKGIFSNQLLGKNQENGFDLPMAYFDLYIPQVAQGMDTRVGRYISLPDIEAQLAPNNYTYTHSLLYTFDCYTQSGINVSTKLSDHWLLQVGISPGCDAAPWTKDAKVTLNTCLGYTWRTALDNIYTSANSINDGKYAYNNMQAYYTTWYHKFTKTGSWHTDTESWYQYERKVPNVNNPAAAPLLETGANGAVCNQSHEVTCYAPDWAILNYVEKQLSNHDNLSIRNEFFDDIKGQRTGFKTRYSEHLIGWGHWVGTTVLFRPELRYERAYDTLVYDNGTKHNQLTFSSDVIFFF